MTLEQLKQLGVKESIAHKYISHLNTATTKHSITSPLRLAHFYAQILHESGMLAYTEELADGSAYEGRKDLGNTEAGDGKLFKGRGFIQITGRLTYAKYGESAGDDTVANPALLSAPKHAADSAAWFWTEFKKDAKGRNLNAMADEDLFLRITYFTNGGFNGLTHRFTLLRRAYAVFSVPDASTRLAGVIRYATSNLSNTERRGMDTALFKALPDSAAIIKLAEVLK
jgi:predicted chitinase